MRGRNFAVVLMAGAMTLAACGQAGIDGSRRDPDAALLQIRSEGGFAPVEFVLGRGPTFTLTNDGRLIHMGPVVAIYPGPLLPNLLVTNISDDQMEVVLGLIEGIGLPDMGHEIDDSAAQYVADATTEVVTYWDEEGEHSYSVYALGIESEPVRPETAAFVELLEALNQMAATGRSVPYEGEGVRVIAGVGGLVDPEFENVHDWPLEETDFSDWVTLPNSWMCRVFGPQVLEAFEGANQSSRWMHPNPMMDAPTFTLLVRPLHPGEPDCPPA